MINREIKLYLRDTCGQERFRQLGGADLIYRNVDGVFTCFSVTDAVCYTALHIIVVLNLSFIWFLQDSFSDVQWWLGKPERYCAKGYVKALVGCKCDTPEVDRKVTKGEARAFASNNNLKLFETSAKDDIGITEAFMWMLEEIVRKQIESEKKKNGHCILMWVYITVLILL